MGEDLKEMGMFGFNSYASNPIAQAVNGQSGNNKSKNFNMNTNAYLELSPIKNLTYKGLISYKTYGSSWRCYLPEYYMNDQGGKRDQDQTTDNLSVGFNWGVTNTVNYKFDVADKNHFDVMIGTEYSKSRPNYGESVNITGYNNIFNDMDHAYIVNTTGTTYNASGSPASYGAKMSYRVPVFSQGNFKVLTLNSVGKAVESSKSYPVEEWEVTDVLKTIIGNDFENGKAWTWDTELNADGGCWGNAGYQAGAFDGNSINGQWWGCAVTIKDTFLLGLSM